MNILIADDDHAHRGALRAALADWGYEVTAVPDGRAAWDILQAETAPKLAVLDGMLPGLDGPEVCRRLRGLARAEPTFVVVLVAAGDRAAATAALEGGADDYAVKPFDREELQARLRVGRRVVGLQAGQQAVVYAFARVVDAKSPHTRGHSDRVARYALALADHLGLGAADRDLLRRGAALHDVGKIRLPDAILNKPGPLTPEEYDAVKLHPVQGARLIEPLDAARDVIPIVRWHHERMDGKGYPDGLPAAQLPLAVRVVAVADVYDALTSDRPYRAGLPHDACAAILRADAAGGGLDPALVERFCEMMRGTFVLPAADAAAAPTPPQAAV
jgi:putative two-component system response regulator